MCYTQTHSDNIIYILLLFLSIFPLYLLRGRHTNNIMDRYSVYLSVYNVCCIYIYFLYSFKCLSVATVGVYAYNLLSAINSRLDHYNVVYTCSVYIYIIIIIIIMIDGVQRTSAAYDVPVKCESVHHTLYIYYYYTSYRMGTYDIVYDPRRTIIYYYYIQAYF